MRNSPKKSFDPYQFGFSTIAAASLLMTGAPARAAENGSVCQFFAVPGSLTAHGVPKAIEAKNQQIARPIHSPAELAPPKGLDPSDYNQYKHEFISQRPKTYGLDPDKNGFGCALSFGEQNGKLEAIDWNAVERQLSNSGLRQLEVDNAAVKVPAYQVKMAYIPYSGLQGAGAPQPSAPLSFEDPQYGPKPTLVGGYGDLVGIPLVVDSTNSVTLHLSSTCEGSYTSTDWYGGFNHPGYLDPRTDGHWNRGDTSINEYESSSRVTTDAIDVPLSLSSMNWQEVEPSLYVSSKEIQLQGAQSTLKLKVAKYCTTPSEPGPQLPPVANLGQKQGLPRTIVMIAPNISTGDRSIQEVSGSARDQNGAVSSAADMH